MTEFQFTKNWFEQAAKPVWQRLIPGVNPTRILEIGSFEGASTCFLITILGAKHPLDVHCIDTWAGGIEHTAQGDIDMSAVEQRFMHNVRTAAEGLPHQVDITIHKGTSDMHLPKLLANGKAGYFDFIYVDGSHQAPDVLLDAVLAFKLLRVGGVMAFDDYLWAEDLPQGRDPLRCPKPAVDAFTTIYFRKVQILMEPLYQLYVQKTAD